MIQNDPEIYAHKLILNKENRRKELMTRGVQFPTAPAGRFDLGRVRWTMKNVVCIIKNQTGTRDKKTLLHECVRKSEYYDGKIFLP
jgi:prophage tail gpP-like protein